MRSAFNRLAAPLRRRIGLMVGRAVLRMIDDANGLQILQVDGLDGETLANVERFQQYGFTSHPHPLAEAAMISLGGIRAHSIVIGVDDRRYRLRGLERGEVALYSDEDQAEGGQRIVLRRGQRIEVHAGKEFTVNVGSGASVLTMTPQGTVLRTPDFQAEKS